ncbi:AsmA-like C-terminal region-containing protein [uncultured Roseovarius sp.]|uniref:YhdP family protein n=1 Tax=uncultured Roseovarius sp. TaxID=293344 RepID=UPI002606159D|nr:AsmA-like C-terminal region-containing protein [uncultured Roseovarius sp.]
MSTDQTQERAAQDGAPPQAGAQRRARRTRRVLRHGVQFCFSCVVLVLLLGALAALGVGATLSAPEWLKERIAVRINESVTDYDLSFGGMSLVVGEDLTPRVALHDVDVAGLDGVSLASLSSLEVSVAPQPLLRGEVQPATVHLSGARLVLRRRASGELSIILEGDGDAGDDTQTFTEQLEAFFARSQFAALDLVTADNLTLRYEDARADRAWSADGGRVQLAREGDEIRLRGDVALLGARDYATTLEVNYTGEIGQNAAEFGVRFEDMPSGDIAGQSPALAWLGALDAPISGALRAGVDDDGLLGPLNATLQIGAGVLQPTPATAPIRFKSARSYFTYQPEAQEIRFTELSVDSAWGQARAEGTARLVGMEAGWPRELQAQIRISDIVADPPGIYPEPLRFEAAAMAMRLQFEPFIVTLGELSLSDQGRNLLVRGEARGRNDGWDLTLEGGIDGLAPERLLALWPRSAKPKTRKWLERSVHSADLSNIQLALRLRPDMRPDFFLGFDFDDLEATYVRDVPPITAASGHASLRDNRFAIYADQGHVDAGQGGAIDVSGTSFVIPDVRIKESPARARLKTRGPVPAALALLDAPPFRFLEKAGQPVGLADGQARLEGELNFLLKDRLTPEEVAFEVTGDLRDVRSDMLVKGRVLSAERLAVDASNRHIEIGGEARIGEVPVRGRWDMAIGRNPQGESRVRGQVEISGRFLDEFGIALPPGSLTGQGQADLEVNFAKGQPGRFTLQSDLAGVGLALPQLSWRLAEGQTGRLDVAGTLGQPPDISALTLTGAGLTAQGQVSLNPGGGLDRAEFSRVAIGDWLDAPVALIGRGAGVAPAIEVTGGTVDLRKTSLGGEGGGAGGGGPVALGLDRLQISDGIALSDFRADLNTAEGTRGRFSGRLNGITPITGEVVPQGGRSAFRIKSDDAGGLMASAGLLQQARNGTLDLVLTPAAKPGSYDGVLGIDSLRVKEAPALGALLNTISVVGLLEQFYGQGLHFSRVDARFRLTPQRLVLLEGSAVGASVGISMDGYYTMANRRMDMQGVVSPVYLLNAIGGAFTRRGEGLIGFNYTLKGSASDPAVSVNPLSALAPGFMRELFRRPAPTVDGGRAGSSGQTEDRGRENEPLGFQRQDR